jgi:(p)ppGpp synthase/HD superfamily hydrolase
MMINSEGVERESSLVIKRGLLCPEVWRPAWILAAEAHSEQTVPGRRANYLAHLGEVVLELISAHFISPLDDLNLAVQCAILHDTIEDQEHYITAVEIEARFGHAVAEGVLALSKSKGLPQGAAMQDSLDRILLQPRSVWCVKLADRVANLQSVPNSWSAKKIAEYRTEASLIVDTLGAANACLSARLRECIASYPPDLPSRSVAGVSDESGHFQRG